jgi:hypothetical protein
MAAKRRTATTSPAGLLSSFITTPVWYRPNPVAFATAAIFVPAFRSYTLTLAVTVTGFFARNLGQEPLAALIVAHPTPLVLELPFQVRSLVLSLQRVEP